MQVLIDGAVIATETSGPGGWDSVSGDVTIGSETDSIVFAVRAVDSGSVGNLIDGVSFRRVANP